MINILGFVESLFHRFGVASRNLSALKTIRDHNPTCRIATAGLRDVIIGRYVAILDQSYLERVNIRDFSYISNNSTLVNVEIGSFCSIGPHVKIGLAPHPSKIFVSTYPAFYSDQNSGCPLRLRENNIFDDSVPKTRIFHDVWIGSNVIIPGGIQIGIGAIIAAGSVVVKDVPAYSVVGGNPAKVLRYRFSQEQIDILLESEWWDWPIDKIRTNVNKFSDIEKFKMVAD